MRIIRSLPTAVAASGILLERGGSSVVGCGQSCCEPDRPRPRTQLPPRSSGIPEVASAVGRLLIMRMRIPETR
jgi:hypothetical protein